MKAQQQEAERRWEEMQSYLRKRTAEHEAAQQGAFRGSSLLLNMIPPFFNQWDKTGFFKVLFVLLGTWDFRYSIGIVQSKASNFGWFPFYLL